MKLATLVLKYSNTLYEALKINKNVTNELRIAFNKTIKGYAESELSSSKLGVNGLPSIKDYMAKIKIIHNENILTILMPKRRDFISRGSINKYGDAEKYADTKWENVAKEAYKVAIKTLSSLGIKKFEDEGIDSYEIFFVTDDLITEN
jgi:hypothetical protein